MSNFTRTSVERRCRVMATCKDCLSYELCSNRAYQEARFLGKDEKTYITIANRIPCKFFKNKADFVEVKHGEWEQYGLRNPQCSLCHSYRIEKSRYCPNCGAKMDGERKDT